MGVDVNVEAVDNDNNNAAHAKLSDVEDSNNYNSDSVLTRIVYTVQTLKSLLLLQNWTRSSQLTLSTRTKQ